MASKKILDRDVKVNEGKFVFKQTTEETYSKFELEDNLMHIRRQKMQLVDQNKKIISQYNLLVEKEKEIMALIESVPDEEIQSI